VQSTDFEFDDEINYIEDIMVKGMASLDLTNDKMLIDSFNALIKEIPCTQPDDEKSSTPCFK